MEAPPSHRPLLAIRRPLPHGGPQRDPLQTASECARREHEVTIPARRAEVDAPAGATFDLVPLPGQTAGGLAHKHPELRGMHGAIVDHPEGAAVA